MAGTGPIQSREQAWQLAMNALHKKGGALHKLKDHDTKAMQAANKAIKALGDTSEASACLRAIIKNGSCEDIPKGMPVAVEVMELQSALKSCRLSKTEKLEINQKIVAKFSSLKGDYPALQMLKNTLEEHSSGSSRLHLLVYSDLEKEYGHQVINIINKSFQNAQKDPSQKDFILEQLSFTKL